MNPIWRMRSGGHSMTVLQKKLLIGLIIMALLSPLGIIFQKKINAEDAWGEWGLDKIEKMLGYVPEGLRKYADFWKAPVPDYNFGGENAGISTQIISYIISGIIGISLAGGAVYLILKLLGKHEK